MPTRTITKAEEESIKAHAKKQKNTIIKAEEEAEGQKKKRISPKRPNQQPQLEPGDNRKYLSNALEIAALPPIDTNNVTEVENRISEYFAICIKNDMKPNMPGMALSLGVDRTTLWKWTNGVEINKPEVVRNTLKKAVNLLNIQMEDYMQNGKINPVSGIFLMKNNMGYQDKQEVVVTPNQVNEVSENSLLEESNLLTESEI